jgi:endonuclease YncB( thermonuclease family)
MFLQPAIRIALLLLALGPPGSAAAAEVLPGPYHASVERVIDGDTLAVRVSVWLGQELRVLVRVRGVDAPELRGDCDAEKARARNAQAALARLVAGGPVVLTAIEGDKYYGRVVADVTTSEGNHVGLALISGGFVRPYDGAARSGWCEIGAAAPRGKVAGIVEQLRGR